MPEQTKESDKERMIEEIEPSDRASQLHVKTVKSSQNITVILTSNAVISQTKVWFQEQSNKRSPRDLKKRKTQRYGRRGGWVSNA
jgi:hypothetical protein